MNVYRRFPDLATLEREYSPSSCIPDVGVFLLAYAERSAQARAANRDMQTLRYGSHTDEAIDFFPAADLGNAPLLIFIHGGYWQQLDKADASFPATDCRRHGIAYAAINYGLAPAVTMSQMIQRCRIAVASLYRQAEELGFDRDSIFLSGSSAGAHLAAMALLMDWEQLNMPRRAIRGAVLLSGIFDLRPLVSTYINGPLGLDSAMARLQSPLLQLEPCNATLPPILLAYGENETSEFKRQSTEFAQALRNRAAGVDLLSITGRNHFDIVFDLADKDTVLGSAALSLIRQGCETNGETS